MFSNEQKDESSEEEPYGVDPQLQQIDKNLIFCPQE